MELPNLIAVICGFTAFFISVVESAWVRWHYFPTAFKESCRSIVGFAGLFSLANAMAALSSTSSVLFDDVSTVCRVAWSYYFMLLLLSNFNPLGYGGEEENTHAAGKILDDAKFTKPMIYAPRAFPCFPCFLWTGEFSYIPNSAWLRRCIFRIRLYMLFAVLLVIARQSLGDRNMLFDDEGRPKPAQNVFVYASVYMVLLGLSGFNPLMSVIAPIVLPDYQGLVKLRKFMFIFFFSIVGGLQPMIFTLVGTRHNVTLAVVAVEMLFFQLLCHKCFVPRFSWSFPPQPLTKEMFDEFVEGGFHFFVPLEDIPNILEKKPGKCGGCKNYDHLVIDPQTDTNALEEVLELAEINRGDILTDVV